MHELHPQVYSRATIAYLINFQSNAYIVIATVAVIFMTLSRPEYDGPVNFEELTPFNFHSRVVNEADKRYVARQIMTTFLTAHHHSKGNVARTVLRKLEQ